MSRQENALLGQKAFGANMTAPMLDPTYGGQFGYAPVLKEWISNQAYVRKNLIPILLESPKFFTRMPDPSKWVDTLKRLVETSARTIEGLRGGLTVEWDEHPIGGAGEMQQEFTDVKRARSEPVFTFVERYGMPIQTFLYHWITYGMADPETKYALSGTLDNAPSDMLADEYTMSMAFIEPDATGRKVMKSWVSANMAPKGTGDIDGKRDQTTASELLTLTIEFTALTQFNLGTNVFAQSLLDQIVMTSANPYLRPSFIDQVSPDVQASSVGFKTGVHELAASRVPGLV